MQASGVVDRSDVFAALAEPNRLRIIELLRHGPRSVNDIADALTIRQPQVSKHLRTLGDAGLVSCHPVAQRRIYRLEPAQFGQIGDWIDSFEQLWHARLDELDHYLNSLSQKGTDDARTDT